MCAYVLGIPLKTVFRRRSVHRIVSYLHTELLECSARFFPSLQPCRLKSCSRRVNARAIGCVVHKFQRRESRGRNENVSHRLGVSAGIHHRYKEDGSVGNVVSVRIVLLHAHRDRNATKKKTRRIHALAPNRLNLHSRRYTQTHNGPRAWVTAEA